MMRLSSRWLIAIGCLLLAGCTSAPVHYYTLSSAVADSTAIEAAPFSIEVLPVGIPAQVDQMQLVVRQDESTISVLDNERWAAPLNEELRSALSIALTQRLGTQDMYGLPKSVGSNAKPLLRVKLEVRRFDSRPGQYALLDADWSLAISKDADNARLLCHSRLQQAVGGDFASLVRGHQQAIAALSEQIASAARSWVASNQATRDQSICLQVKN